MTVDYHWHDDEKTAVVFTIVYPWTVEELAEAESDFRKELVKLPHVVDTIFDMREGKTIPPNMISYLQYSVNKGEQITNEGVTIIVGSNEMGKVVGRIVKTTTQTDDMFFVNTLDEVEATLTKVRAQRGAGS